MNKFILVILVFFTLAYSCSKVDHANPLVFIPQANLHTSKFEVSVGEFEKFINTTSYTTTADSIGWSGVYSAEKKTWLPIQDANWNKQDGTKSFNKNLPVTQVSYYDACAYCAWKRGRLPSEEEWDKLAGNVLTKGNYWEGYFPIIDKGSDGYKVKSAPVGKFEENAFGLNDVYGNVWEWTSTPKQGQRVIKGGSFLCDINVCAGFTPGNHQLTEDDSGLNHLGFRCVFN